MTTLQKKRWVIKCSIMAEYFTETLISLLFRLIPVRIKLSQIGLAYRESRLLFLAVKLNLADLIAKRNIDVDDLAKELNIDADNLYPLLRSLVSFGVFIEITPRVFCNNNMSNQLKQSSESGLHQNILTNNDKRSCNLWFEQLDLVFNSTCEVELDHHLVDEPFNQFTYVNLGSKVHLNPFIGVNWALFDLVLDIGNANGQHISDILSISEDMNICIYDNHIATSSAKMFWQCQKTSNTKFNSTIFRLSFEEGEILRSLPRASSHKNLYTFVNVFSRLNDTDCLRVLINAQKAIGPFTATIAIIDSVRSERLSSSRAAINDMQLLLDKHIKQRSIEQWTNLISRSDFTITEIIDLASLNKVLVLKHL